MFTFIFSKFFSVKKENNTESQVKRVPTLKERAVIKVKNMYFQMKKAFNKSSKFGLFLFQGKYLKS
jgi:hypothetical protein